jgi:N-acetylmuramic acid 6-phosphate etherase
MLKTETRNPKTKNIDKMDTLSMLKIINEDNLNSVKAVEAELENVAKAVDVISEGFKNGGRLFYVGAGTSGRIGVMDASECPPTYGVTNEKVVGIIAGGDKNGVWDAVHAVYKGK